LPENQTNEYAERGTRLHSETENIVKGLKEGKYVYDGMFINTNEDEYSEDSLDAVFNAFQFIEYSIEDNINFDLLKTEEKKEKEIRINIVNEFLLKGTCDLIYDNRIVIDYKFGNKPVSENTLQLVAYSFLNLTSNNKTVSCAIVQNGQVKSRIYTKKDIEQEIKSIFETIINAEGLQQGTHCKYCPCISHCSKHSLKQLPFETEFTAENINLEYASNILPLMERAVQVIKDRLQKHLMEGGQSDKYYIEMISRKNRAFDDYEKVEETLKQNNLPAYRQEKFSPAQLEKEIGKRLYTKLIEELVTYTITETKLLKRKETGKEISYSNQDLLNGMMD